jgi:RHS repeat-associated protein
MDIKSPVAEARNEYTYSAGGQKLKVVQKWNPSYSTAPVVGSAINTAALTMTKTTDYVGNIIYENSALKRILVDGGYIEGGVYHYYLDDHLGNNRVVVNASGTVMQRNHFYPFGMAFAENTVTEQGKQPYKYNNKELDQMHGLNWYDYSARYLNMDIPRFGTMDPLAEKHYNWSPYVYVLNNPMRYIDPNGKIERDPNGNVKFYASGQTSSREAVKDSQGWSYTPTYNTGYVVTDKGNKVESQQLVSVSVVTADGRTGSFSAAELGKIGDYDFTSNCFGLAMADGQVVINEPETVLKDEYTQVGQEKGANMDNVSNTDHNVLTVGNDAMGTLYHAGTSDGKGTYTHKDDNTKIRTNEPVERVVDLFGKGTVGGVDVPDLDIHLYKKNQ